MITHTHNEILKQKNFTESGFEAAPKLLKAFFLETIYMAKLRDTRSSNSGSFSSTDLKFSGFIAK